MKKLFDPGFMKDRLALPLILIAAFLLRFWHLNYQSLWLDELHTMREADPSLSWEGLASYLKCCDQHPPLFFLAEKYLFIFFGFTQQTARCLTAAGGVFSVWAMYLLGRELVNRDLGLIVAALTCINYYDIYYSQEARDYIFAFLFSALSYLYFIRLVRTLKLRDTWLYALFTLLTMYSHYYGLFVACSQFVIAFVLMLSDRGKWKTWFSAFGLSGVLILAGYAPWLPFLKGMTQIKSFWISPIAPGFFIDFFKNYFGDNDALQPLLYALLLFYTIFVFTSYRKSLPVTKAALPLSFLIFLVSVLITYGIPYIRSRLVVPMLFNRYTIVVLPLFLLVLGYAIYLIRYRAVKYFILTGYVLISFIGMAFDKKYYSRIRKTQFRELTAFIASDTSSSFPVLNDRTAWQQEYYFQKFGYKGQVLAEKKEDMIDSILAKSSPKYNVRGFWLMDAHGARLDQPALDSILQKKVDSSFVLAREIKLYDAWGKLYLARGDRDPGAEKRDSSAAGQ